MISFQPFRARYQEQARKGPVDEDVTFAYAYAMIRTMDHVKLKYAVSLLSGKKEKLNPSSARIARIRYNRSCHWLSTLSDSTFGRFMSSGASGGHELRREITFLVDLTCNAQLGKRLLLWRGRYNSGDVSTRHCSRRQLSFDLC